MKKHYLIYQITNDVNGKIYIGKHETFNVNDDYFGSGKQLKRAIKKYGLENFTKTILIELQNAEEMNLLEKLVVTPEFCAREDVYNINVGGDGGWNYVNQFNSNKIFNKSKGGKVGGPAFHKKYLTNMEFRQQMNMLWASNLQKTRLKYPDKFNRKKDKNSFYGLHHTEAAKRKISEKNKILLRGNNNGSFGTIWIYNEELQISKKIKKENIEQYLKFGWKIGRKIKFS